MRNRFYMGDGRFYNADILTGTITRSPSLNRYAYANGNPVSNVDPLGLFFLASSSIYHQDYAEKIYTPTTAEFYNAIELATNIGKRATIENDTISISVEKEGREIENVSKILGLEVTCDLIAESACDKFFDENGREFMLTDDCVSKEILDHIKAYDWAVGNLLFPNYLAAGFTFKRKLNNLQNGNLKAAFSQNGKKDVYEATKSIDMRESDIVKISGIAYYSSQAYLFDYKDGLREEYVWTKYDPWANRRKYDERK